MIFSFALVADKMMRKNRLVWECGSLLCTLLSRSLPARCQEEPTNLKKFCMCFLKLIVSVLRQPVKRNFRQSFASTVDITLCLPRPHHPTWKLQRIPVFALRRSLRSKSQLFDFTLLNLTLKDLTEINSSFSWHHAQSRMTCKGEQIFSILP